MATEKEIEAAARAMKPSAFSVFDRGYTCQNYLAERAFLNAEKNVKRARKDARLALAAAETVRQSTNG
jgi:hypothetical protein